jgi:AraC family transcriptional regulator
MRTWSYVGRDTNLRHLDLHFDLPRIVGRFAGELDSARLAEPRLMFESPRILQIAQLLAAECQGPALLDLYGDSLVLALFIELFDLRQASTPRSGKLAGRRLRQAVEYMEENCLRNIKLQELADLVGLSQTYFSSAFKASTGLACSSSLWALRQPPGQRLKRQKCDKTVKTFNAAERPSSRRS